MAFFKFRKSSGDAPVPEAPAQSIESIRQRAKYRLAGASVLILLGVIVLPLLFDKQPRPIAVDTPIEIPDKNKVLPLSIPAAPPVAAASAVAPAPEPASVHASAPSASVAKSVAAATEPVDSPAVVKSDASAPVAAVPVVKPPASAVAISKPAEVNRAQALLDGKEVPAATASKSAPASAAGPRFVVQVGAFADDARAREVRLKVERAGLKTYAQVAETKDGKRIRVRVGPFATRAEAEKAATRIKRLDLPAALLTL